MWHLPAYTRGWLWRAVPGERLGPRRPLGGRGSTSEADRPWLQPWCQRFQPLHLQKCTQSLGASASAPVHLCLGLTEPIWQHGLEEKGRPCVTRATVRAGGPPPRLPPSCGSGSGAPPTGGGEAHLPLLAPPPQPCCLATRPKVKVLGASEPPRVPRHPPGLWRPRLAGQSQAEEGAPDAAPPSSGPACVCGTVCGEGAVGQRLGAILGFLAPGLMTKGARTSLLSEPPPQLHPGVPATPPQPAAQAARRCWGTRGTDHKPAVAESCLPREAVVASVSFEAALLWREYEDRTPPGPVSDGGQLTTGLLLSSVSAPLMCWDFTSSLLI